jgi:hypothetical protein
MAPQGDGFAFKASGLVAGDFAPDPGDQAGRSNVFESTTTRKRPGQEMTLLPGMKILTSFPARFSAS